MMAYALWWIAAAVLIAVELVTGTFYLLVIGVAVACGGIAAWLGAAAPLQWLIAGGLAVAGTFWIKRWKRNIATKTPSLPGLDIGAQVEIISWGANRTARVAYRGSTWDAELLAPDTPQKQVMFIAAMRGSVLILSDQRPAAASLSGTITA
jgi:membrane protein implicated in regulation of membrane protease activity